MDRAVRRGLKHREPEGLAHLGIDEKSFRSGQSSISLLTDLDESRVLEVREGGDQETAEALWQSLPAEQRRSIEAVALDMAPAFIAVSRAAVPQAKLVHDKFHVAKHLNEARPPASLPIPLRRLGGGYRAPAGTQKTSATNRRRILSNSNSADSKWLAHGPSRNSSVSSGLNYY